MRYYRHSRSCEPTTCFALPDEKKKKWLGTYKSFCMNRSVNAYGNDDVKVRIQGTREPFRNWFLARFLPPEWTRIATDEFISSETRPRSTFWIWKFTIVTSSFSIVAPNGGLIKVDTININFARFNYSFRNFMYVHHFFLMWNIE